MAMMLQLIFVLSTLISITVSSDVAGLVGGSVQLDYGQHSETTFNSLFWTFNRATNILKYDKERNDITVYPPYKYRAEFNDTTYSLTLWSLKKTDSGLYTVRASGEKNTVVAEYRLSVWDQVETPVLNLQLTSNPCDIILTCRAHDLSVNCSHYKKTCNQDVTSSPGGVTLSLSVSGVSFTCNHSNPVSWKEDVLEIVGDFNPFCGKSKGSGSSAPAPAPGGSGLYSIILILMLSSLF